MAMRRSFVLPLSLLIVSAGLAGCMGGDADEDVPAAVDPDAAAPSEAMVDDGTTEMATDLGHMPHLHDYWLGRERVTIMDDEVAVEPFEAVVFTFFDVFMGTPGVGGTFFRLPEDSIVYEGTGKMEITVSWSDPTVTGAGLRYRTPANEEFTEVQALTQGAPLAFDVSPEMTDMPHDKESRWMFLLVPASPGQAIVGKLHVKIDIIKMGDIALFPGHPELFGGEHTLVLFEGAATSSTQNFATRIVGFMTQNEQESGVRSSKVVPMETLSMTANVTITSATTNIGTVSNVTFLYHAAGEFGWHRADVLSADLENGVFQFAWPVEMTQTDSPYAKSSQWAFDLRIQTDPAGQGWETNGLADAEVSYDLVVVAYDSLIDGVEPPAPRER